MIQAVRIMCVCINYVCYFCKDRCNSPSVHVLASAVLLYCRPTAHAARPSASVGKSQQ